VHPQHTKCAPRQSKSQFLGIFWRFGVVDFMVLDCLLRTTSRKRSSTFFKEKSAAPDKILAMPMVDLLFTF